MNLDRMYYVQNVKLTHYEFELFYYIHTLIRVHRHLQTHTLSIGRTHMSSHRGKCCLWVPQ